MAKHQTSLPHSSSISDCEFDDVTNEMHITFASGGRHKFKDVSKEVYDGLIAAKSPGIFFHSSIRRKFNSEKVD